MSHRYNVPHPQGLFVRGYAVSRWFVVLEWQQYRLTEQLRVLQKTLLDLFRGCKQPGCFLLTALLVLVNHVSVSQGQTNIVQAA